MSALRFVSSFVKSDSEAVGALVSWPLMENLAIRLAFLCLWATALANKLAINGAKPLGRDFERLLVKTAVRRRPKMDMSLSESELRHEGMSSPGRRGAPRKYPDTRRSHLQDIGRKSEPLGGVQHFSKSRARLEGWNLAGNLLFSNCHSLGMWDCFLMSSTHRARVDP